MRSQALEALLSPRALAVVGASPRSPIGVQVVANLLTLGYPGRLVVVHPGAAPVLGVAAVPSLADLAEPVDAAALLLRPGRVLAAAAEVVAAGAKALWVFSGGTGTGQEGLEMAAALSALAASTGVAVGGPNCMGAVVPPARFAAWLGTVTPDVRPGRVAAVVQSGAVGEALIGLGSRIGWRAIVSTGNETVVDATAYAGHLLDDPDLGCLLLFLEGVARPDAFVALLARTAERDLPVAAVKVGRSDVARAGVIAHTGALAGSDRVFDAVLRQFGVFRAADLDELIEFAAAASIRPRPRGRRIFVVTNSGGEGSLLADLATDAGLALPPPSAMTTARLREEVPAAVAANPLDLWGTGDPGVVFGAGLAAAAADRPDLLVLALDQQDRVGEDERSFVAGTVAAAVRVHQASAVPTAILSFVAAGEADPAVLEATPDEVPVLRGARASARAVAGLIAPRRARRATPALAPAARAIAAQHAHGPLDEVDSATLLQAAGVPIAAGRLVHSGAEAESAARDLGGQVAVKIVGSQIPHKAAIGGVVVGVGPAEAAGAFASVVAGAGRAGVPYRGVLVQPLRSGLELLVGGRRDEQFGPVIVLGLGGALAEALDVVALRVAPIDRADVLAMLAELGATTPVGGVAGSRAMGAEPLVAAALALSALLVNESRVLECEVNPFVLTAASGIGVDALVVLGP